MPYKPKPCTYVEAGKTRGGRPRYYCTAHGYYTSSPSQPCPGSLIEKYSASLPELSLDIADYPGGIGLWGALPPIIDTTGDATPVFGVHVHARREPGGEKQVDDTFRRVKLYLDGEPLIEVTADAAVSYTLSVVSGFSPETVRCTHCGRLHSDKAGLAVYPHRYHLCGYCGRKFSGGKRAIGNELSILKRLLPQYYRDRARVTPDREISIDLDRDRVRVWAANPAILWTAPRPEEEGIHVHTYEDGRKTVDDTFGRAYINGKPVDPEAARILMAQLTYSILEENIIPRLAAVRCPHCGAEILYRRENAFKARRKVTCGSCGETFNMKRAVIPQPLAWMKSYGYYAKLREHMRRP